MIKQNEGTDDSDELAPVPEDDFDDSDDVDQDTVIQ